MPPRRYRTSERKMDNKLRLKIFRQRITAARDRGKTFRFLLLLLLLDGGGNRLRRVRGVQRPPCSPGGREGIRRVATRRAREILVAVQARSFDVGDSTTNTTSTTSTTSGWCSIGKRRFGWLACWRVPSLLIPRWKGWGCRSRCRNGVQ